MQFLYFFSERIAIEPQEFRSLNLIASGFLQSPRNQRPLDRRNQHGVEVAS